MTLRQLKSGYFVIEGLNAAATAYYFFYLFFYLQKNFGFGNLGNLTCSALNGFIYMFAAWYGGKFARRRGYYTSLTLGFSVMSAALFTGLMWNSVTGQFLVMAVWTIGVCFTWPTLQALISENVSSDRLPRMVGIYNVVWAGSGALSYFFGGVLFEKLGQKSLFWLPLTVHLSQLLLLRWLFWKSRSLAPARLESGLNPPRSLEPAVVPPSIPAENFLRMAWAANPFAYIAINTVVAVIPELAQRLHLSPTLAGFSCSLWFFVRLAMFVVLWHWTGWHYHFAWLVGAFVALVLSFTALLLIPRFWVLIAAQILFGGAVGLIYYSSLFYSMDLGESKSEHGGFHEAAIGLGIFLGPAVGAAALRLLPQQPNSGAWAVSGLLLLGLGFLFAVKSKRKGL